MKNYIKALQSYFAHTDKKELIIRIAIIIGAVGLIVAIISFVQNYRPKVEYPPASACDLLTKEEAQDLLGDQVLGGDSKPPVISGSVATSKCGYTDMNRDQSNMMVAAVAIRSGVNDKGVRQNRSEFEAEKANDTVQVVDDLGEGAYYNPELGQLNILNGYDWIILSYGVGESPSLNELDEMLNLAWRVLPPPNLPTY